MADNQISFRVAEYDEVYITAEITLREKDWEAVSKAIPAFHPLYGPICKSLRELRFRARADFGPVRTSTEPGESETARPPSSPS